MEEDPRSGVIRKLNELRKQLSSAESAEEKGQTKTLVKEALAKYFDHDMQQRRAELDRLTKRADEMAALLTKRAAAKDELIELQLKASKYEADGLGLFSEGRTVPRTLGRVADPRVAGSGSYPLVGDPFAAPAAEQPSSTRVMNWPVRHEVGASQPPTVETNPLKAAMSRVKEARRKLQGADTQEDESEATTGLREALDEYFDLDMELRQKELDEVKKGLQDMSDRLQKRADAKDEIVDLQLQMIVNEAEGLGFFRGSDASNVLLPVDMRLKQRSGFRSRAAESPPTSP